MTGGEGAGGPIPASRGRRLGALGRRYYPLGIAGAFLATVVGFFPSVVPLGAGGALLFGGGAGIAPSTAPARPPAPAPFATAAGSEPFPLSAVPGFAPSGSDLFVEGPGGTGTPPAGPSPAPGPQPSACPLPVPSTGTPLDAVLAAVTSLCQQLTGALPPVPVVPSLLGIPGTAPTPTPGASAPAAAPRVGPPVFVMADAALGGWRVAGVTGVPGAPTVVLGMVEGAGATPAVAAATTALHRAGAVVDVLLVPDAGAAGGPAAFAAWVSRALAGLPGVDAAAVGIGAPPSASEVPVVAGDAVAGLGAAERAVPAARTGLWWGDGGAATTDAPVWAALAAAANAPAGAAVLRAAGFLEATVAPVAGATAASGVPVCSAVVAAGTAASTAVTRLRSALGAVPALGAVALVLDTASEAASSPSPLPACTVPPAPPGDVATLWRLGAGPVPGP